MKTRRLSEIDLARLAALPTGPQLDQALRTYNASGGAWSYDPVRDSTADILGARTPLYGTLSPVSWDQIRRQIERACLKGDTQAKSNVEVGKILFAAARQHKWSAAKHPMGRMPIGIGETVRYWSDVILGDEQGQFVPFIDHRRGRGVSSAGSRQIIFSMQHLWVREREPDLLNARLAIIRFPSSDDSRSIRIDFAKDEELLSYADLDARVRAVYEAWARVSEEKLHESRSTGTHGGNPFGF